MFASVYHMGVDALVLSQRADASLYRDDESGYEFPKQYLSLFEPLSVPGSVRIALIHEPQRTASGRTGRGGYVGWAVLDTPPVPVPVPEGTRPLWRVGYSGGLMPLPRPVRLEEDGRMYERWLERFERGTARNQVLNGRSVRRVPLANVLSVLHAAGAAPDELADWQPESAPLFPALPQPELPRERVLVERLVRARGFRTQVLSAYSWRCAVTGWQARPGMAGGLLDAAHLVPVQRGGQDDVRNGVSLTPTVHRLFDAGVIGFQATPEGLILRAGALGVSFQGQGGRLDLQDGLQLHMPGDRRLWPLG